MRLLLACALTSLLMLAGLATVGYQPANAADGPQRDTDAELLRAIEVGCVESLGLFRVEIQAGVLNATCRPGLGTGPAVKVRR
jgi:hypothetical protein